MSHHCGFVLLLCYELSVMIHLAISLNRFCAVWAPYKYQNIFSDRNTKILIGFVGTVTGSIAIYFYEGKLHIELIFFSSWTFIVSCHFYYDEKIHFLTFTNSEFCGYIGWYGDFLKNAVIVAIVVSIDILTVVKVKQMSKKVNFFG